MVYQNERDDKMENHKNEFTFSKHSIIAYVWRGILVGIIAGAIVSLFRLLIEMISEKVIDYYHQAHSNLMLLVPIAGFSILAVFSWSFGQV